MSMLLDQHDRDKLKLYLSYEIGQFLTPSPEYEIEFSRLTQQLQTSLPTDMAERMAEAALRELISTVDGMLRANQKSGTKT